MDKTKILLFALVAIFVIGATFWFKLNKKAALTTPLTQQITKEAVPSETLTQYIDPSGFTISYPDNLSITKNDIEDQSTYASIQLSSKDVNGSLTFKITDSKFTTLDEWAKSETTDSKSAKEAKLGSLKAQEIRLNDRLLLGALDQGILFTIDVPLVEEKFWSKVYAKVLDNFSFSTHEAATSGADSSDDISFEGEEVVE